MTDACVACLAAAGTLVDTPFGNSWSRAGQCDDACFADGAVADALVEQLHAKRRQQQQGQPWFMAAGFRNPHLPWYAPTRFFEQVAAAVPAAERVAPHPHQPEHALRSGDPYDIFEFKLMNDLSTDIYNNSGVRCSRFSAELFQGRTPPKKNTYNI